MSKDRDTIQMLEVAAEALAPLLSEIAFVGGAVAWLYLDAESSAPLRPTDDVDCVIEVSTRLDYAKLEETLRGFGFKHDISSKLICRWEISGIKVDMMPTNPEILGFSNQWYVEGLKDRVASELPSGRTISIFPLPYFLASKFEALQHRGGSDWRLAHDLEDILFVLDGCDNPLAEMRNSDAVLLRFLSESAKSLTERSDFDELLLAHLAQEDEGRVSRLRKLVESISRL